jgi:TrmH family RNA methyltransferase
MTDRLKSYKKESNYSYVFGASPAIELLAAKSCAAECIYMRTSYRDIDGLTERCRKLGIPVIISDKAFNIAGCKESCFVFGVFKKYDEPLFADKPHIVLVNPSDMGNIGTIIRTAAGLKITDIAIIEPAADSWNPKTVRASMGEIFHVRHQRFASFDDYISQFPSHERSAFMCDGALLPEDIEESRLVSLIFGNESSGLDSCFATFCNSVRIPFCDNVDSFNLSSAVAIGAYIYARNCKLI